MKFSVPSVSGKIHKSGIDYNNPLQLL